MSKKSLKKQVFEYIKAAYGGEEEHPWIKFPDYAVFRHGDNKKWYALVMNISKSKLGFEDDTNVDIINLKLDDLLLRDYLINQEGILRGYHISRGNWISVLLDGTVPLERITGLIDISFRVTASVRKKTEIRGPKEWIVPSNPKYYDIEHAFDGRDTIEWKQGKGIKAGDTVFMYVGAPVSAILYKCEVTQVNIPFNYFGESLNIKGLMRIRLQKRYAPDRFTFDVLKSEYGVFAVRGPRGIPHSLSEALK